MSTTSSMEDDDSSASSSRIGGKVVEVPCLKTIDELGKTYRGQFQLNLKVLKVKKKKKDKDKHEIGEDCLNKAINGREPWILVKNTVDNETLPLDFTYVTANFIGSPSILKLFDPSYLSGCDCTHGCQPDICNCPSVNFPYDMEGKVQVLSKVPIYECNSACKCDPSKCQNRVVQNGPQVKLCVFRTADGRGWGLKAIENISRNTFVMQYCGEVITSEEGDRRGRLYDAKQQTYLFDLDFHDGNDGLFTIDAYHYGNAARFINHSCNPNLKVYSIWINTHDPRLPVIGLFAKRRIRKGEELSFDYRMSADFNGNPSPNKHFSPQRERVLCACKAKKCRKYLV